MQSTEISIRAPGHVDNLIRRLEEWVEVRKRINEKPERRGRPLQMDDLQLAVAFLKEYSALCLHLRTKPPEEESHGNA